MAEIYLTGAVRSWAEPWSWQQDIKDDYEDHEFVNPFLPTDYTLGDEEVYDDPAGVIEPAFEQLEEVDGVFVRYDSTVPLARCNMEVFHAYREGIPVVVWDVTESDKRLPPEMLYHIRYADRDRDQALRCLLMYAGESAEDVVGK